MSCIYGKTLLPFALVCATAMAHAVTIFEDNFDSLVIDQSIQTQNDWITNGYDIGQQQPHVRGPQEGITPYSGGQMLQMRTAIEKDNARSVSNANVNTLSKAFVGQYRFWSASVRIFVREAAQVPMKVRLGVNAGLSQASYGVTFDLLTGIWEGKDRISVHRGTSVINRGAWNEFRVDVDWQTLRCTPVLNGSALGSVNFDLPLPSLSDRYISTFNFGARTNADQSANYSYPEGGQPVYADDYRVEAVPEPAALTTLGLATLFLSKRHRR